MARPTGAGLATPAGAVMASPGAEPVVAAQNAPEIIGGRLLTGRPLDALGEPMVPRGRVVLNPVHPDENLHSLDPAVISPDFVSGLVLQEQVRLADSALPWSYWIDPAAAEQFDRAMIAEAVAVWDGLPGSRWRAAFAGITETSAGEPVADGRSTIFAESDCGDLITANTYLFTDGGLGIDRYGTRTTQILEADVGICPGADSATVMRRAIVHEMGHVIGLAHLCDPDDDCWHEGMGEESHGCRILFWQARTCQEELSRADIAAVARLYPRVRPLEGSTIEEAAARVSFASTPDGSAPAVAVVSADASSPAVAAAARFVAAADGPLLISEPDVDTCLSGPGATEVSRTLQRRGRLLLVGEWPASCAQLAFDWDLRLRVIDSEDAGQSLSPVEAEVAVVVTDSDDGRLGPAVALAARRDTALVVLDPRGPSAAQREWFEEAPPAEILVVGSDTEIDAPLFDGIPTTLVDVEDAVGVSNGQTEMMYLGGADPAAAVGRRRHGRPRRSGTVDGGADCLTRLAGWEVGLF